MELRNRVRKPIDNVLLPELKGINQEYPLMRKLVLHLEETFLLCGTMYFGEYGILKMEFFMMEKYINIKKQLQKLLESFSKASGELSKGHLNNIIDFMNTSRVILEAWENSSFDELKALLDFVCASFDMITVISWKNLLDDPSCEELVEKVWYAVVVSTVALLSSVYQYLLGYVLKGGTKAYSSGSLDFRDTFVSLLLFQGSYVWIFFRDVAAKRTVYCRSKKDGSGRVKYEPRFKPHREKLSGGTTIKFDHLSLGGYDSHRDAEIVCQIAGYYYERDEGQIQLRDGSFFTIPEQEESLSGKGKAQWVAARAKEVFKNFQVKNNAIILPSETNALDVHTFFQHVACERFSLDALWDAADAHPVDSEFVDRLCAVGEGLEGTAASPCSSDSNFVDSLFAITERTPASPSMAEQVVLRMERPQSLDMVGNDADTLTMQESISQQLKEHLEAIDRRIAEQHEQHLQREMQLEEHVLQLRLENERLKCLI